MAHTPTPTTKTLPCKPCTGYNILVSQELHSVLQSLLEHPQVFAWGEDISVVSPCSFAYSPCSLIWIKSVMSSHTDFCAQQSPLWVRPGTPRNGLSSEALGPRNCEKHSTCKVLYLMALGNCSSFHSEDIKFAGFSGTLQKTYMWEGFQRRYRHSFQLKMEVDNWLTELLKLNLMVFFHNLWWRVHRALGTDLGNFKSK